MQPDCMVVGLGCFKRAPKSGVEIAKFVKISKYLRIFKGCVVILFYERWKFCFIATKNINKCSNS